MSEEKEYNSDRKRDIIKNILIIFLAVMLVLTFFSNTIMNRSLPEIQTEKISCGKLTERIRGSGAVESNQTYEVKVDGNKVIDTIMVKTGQEVKKDDVLFVLGSDENKELSDAEDALSALELEYRKALLTVPADYSAENQAINNARQDLNNAIAKRDSAYANSGITQQALAEYNNNKSELSSKTAQQEKISSAISAIDSDDYMSAPPEYTGNLPVLYKAYTTADTDYNTAYELYSQTLTGQSQELPVYDYSTDEESGYERVPATENSQIEFLRQDCEKKETVRNNALSAYNSEKVTVRNDLIVKLQSIQSEIDYLNVLINSYESSGDSGSSSSLEDYDLDVQTKQRTLEDLIISLNKTKSEKDIANQSSNLDIEAKKAEIEKQKKKVEKLKEENSSTEVKSKYSGVVSAINVKTGEETVPDSPLAVIDITEEGYTVKLTVDGEKAKKVKKGTEAEVLNNWNGDITAVVSEIKNDTQANSKNRILVFSVEGDVDSGTSLDLSIPCGSGTYDAIVPKSAVYQDKDGYFVLTVKSKSTPLGNRYYAERVKTEVLASDEISSAVQGDISQGDYIITASSKPVSDGVQVRMKED